MLRDKFLGLQLCLLIFLVIADTPEEESPWTLARHSIAVCEKNLTRAHQLALRGWHLAHCQESLHDMSWTQLALGIIYRNKGKSDSALVMLQAAEQAFRKQNLVLQSARALTEAGAVYSGQTFFDKSHELLQTALQRLRNVFPFYAAQTAEVHRELGVNYLRRQLLNQSLAHLDTARKIYAHINDRYGLAQTLNNIGLCYRNMGDAENALKYYLQALDVFEQIKEPKRAMAALLINIANLSVQPGDTAAQSVDSLYAKAFRIAADFRDTLRLMNAAYNKSYYLLATDRKEEAIRCLHEALRWSRSADMKIEQAGLEIQLGIALAKQNRRDEALAAFHRAVESYQQSTNPDRAVYALEAMANLLWQQSKYEQAIETGLKAWAIKQRNENYRFNLPRIQAVLGECYLQIGKTEKARFFAESLLQEGRLSNRKTTVLSAYQLFYRIDSAEGNIKSELTWLKKYHALKDSIMSAEKAKTLEALRTAYITGKIKNENLLQAAELDKQNAYLRAVAVILLLMLFFLAVFIKQSIQRKNANAALKQKNEKITSKNIEISRRNKQLTANNRKLAALNNEKTNLIRIITHDLRTPLGNISSLAQVALGNKGDNREMIGMMQQIAKDALDTVAQLLNWQSLSKGELVVNRETIKMGEMLHMLADRFALESQRKLINMHVLVSKDDPRSAIGDRNFTRNILENLISNALKFSPQGKNVYLEVESRAEILAVKVRDEGPGIRPEEMPQLFGQFRQLSARPTGGEPSSGLGLHIAKRYAKAMSGDLICESTPGEGATFILLLPQAPDLSRDNPQPNP